MIRYGYIVI